MVAALGHGVYRLGTCFLAVSLGEAFQDACCKLIVAINVYEAAA